MRIFIALNFFVITLFSIQTTYAETNRGSVSSRPCPYSCKTQGLKKGECRDWREGSQCFVEALSKPAPGNNSKWIDPEEETRFGSGLSSGSDRNPSMGLQNPGRSALLPPSDNSKKGRELCAQTKRYELARPLVNIAGVKKLNNGARAAYRVYGSVEGLCLIEAGYFEGGRKRQDFPISTDRDFRRFEFSAQIQGDRFPEIRVYNIHGDRDVYQLDSDLIQDDYSELRRPLKLQQDQERTRNNSQGIPFGLGEIFRHTDD